MPFPRSLVTAVLAGALLVPVSPAAAIEIAPVPAPSAAQLARVDAALRALPSRSAPHRGLRRRARATAGGRGSSPACPDGGGGVRGSESWSRTLAATAGRTRDRARVSAVLTWQGTVGDDARLRSWGHRMTVDVAIDAQRRFRLVLRRDGLDPRMTARPPRTGGRWTGRGRTRRVDRALGTIATVARETLERAARAALLESERRWYDEFACVRLDAAPAGAKAVAGAAIPVRITAQATGGGPVLGTVAVTDVARGRVTPPNGPLPLVTTFTGTEPGAAGLIATATSRRGRGRTRWDVALSPAPAGTPEEPRAWRGFTQVALSAVELDGTVTHFKEELPGPDDTATTKWQGSGKMSYRTAPPDHSSSTPEDFTKWWDWDLLDPRDDQVGTMRVLYEASMSARVDQWVEDKQSTWDCSWTMPDAAKPKGLTAILSRYDGGYEVFWSFLPALPRCPDGAPRAGFQPLPTEALVTRFKGGDVFTGEHHISRIPIDIDHRWTDSAGSHRITWKGAVYVSEPIV